MTCRKSYLREILVAPLLLLNLVLVHLLHLQALLLHKGEIHINKRLMTNLTLRRTVF
jgi:hypothetical protein